MKMRQIFMQELAAIHAGFIQLLGSGTNARIAKRQLALTYVKNATKAAQIFLADSISNTLRITSLFSMTRVRSKGFCGWRGEQAITCKLSRKENTWFMSI
ncbi:hypothetical protein ACMD2_25637 [Ananas comosus]|uniref:Uncharacterized protein n=1 Tax=Ananas comosus TaxID=4615 RepID=A0A199V9Y0_ANACO|nr:hypothetical protein ACMD2_25637 [Ananas comosus]